MKKMLSGIKKGIMATWNWFKSNLKDKITRRIFYIVFLVMSCPIWGGYLLSVIFKNGWWAGIASACWLFWAGPGTPFLPLCLGITIGVRSLIKKLWRYKDESNIKNQ